jgi:hypothetical protein
MQQKKLINAVQGQSVRHEARDLASAPRWVVDGKPLEPGKYSVATAHRGCDSGCGAPAVEKKK